LEAFTQRTLAGLAKIRGGGLPLLVAHSGTFRVLCAHLGIEPRAQVENCRPLRFVPPRLAITQWTIEALDFPSPLAGESRDGEI